MPSEQRAPEPDALSPPVTHDPVGDSFQPLIAPEIAIAVWSHPKWPGRTDVQFYGCTVGRFLSPANEIATGVVRDRFFRESSVDEMADG